MTLGLKFLLIFDFKKSPFRYVFSIAIMCSCETVWVKMISSKGWMVAVRNYSTNTIMKKTNRGNGVGLRIINFQGLSKKLENFSGITQNVLMKHSLGHFELHFCLCQPQTGTTAVV